ncbi:hypothetical protein RAL01_004127 [Vibrio vulnificus]|uniref:hypothetical protein n=1 Tax=Vibrio TaxID=662 RepID=UPI00084D4364|nr:hypothetical protein [Vibrio cholerae]EIX4890159.1 hypothetical protein [Vibrio vulnificus]EIZ1411891.1 hypothetical protein [Vibrio vulnificus]EJA3296859.1 hypothetical protein [Vibrio vulnificus]EJN6713367.1 hypothetical protein [Vibrio vulnificus]ELB7645970.1 hypothetical protein [Vibrio vulnificus]
MTQTCEKFTNDMLVGQKDTLYFRRLNKEGDGQKAVIAVYKTREDKENGTNLYYIAEETRTSPSVVEIDYLWGEEE